MACEFAIPLPLNWGCRICLQMCCIYLQCPLVGMTLIQQIWMNHHHLNANSESSMQIQNPQWIGQSLEIIGSPEVVQVTLGFFLPLVNKNGMIIRVQNSSTTWSESEESVGGQYQRRGEDDITTLLSNCLLSLSLHFSQHWVMAWGAAKACSFHCDIL